MGKDTKNKSSAWVIWNNRLRDKEIKKNYVLTHKMSAKPSRDIDENEIYKGWDTVDGHSCRKDQAVLVSWITCPQFLVGGLL